MVQTHASWVFLAPPLVFKMKKPVNFGFLDFSTLEKRRVDCENEVTLNRRLAPGVYLGVEPVCEGPDGPCLGGMGPVLEWVVKMRQMDARQFLSQRLRRGEVDEAMIGRVVERLEAFYRTQPPLPLAEVAQACRRLEECVRGNFSAALEFTGHSLSGPALAAIEAFSTTFEDHWRSLLESRARNGWIRDGHGDLHSEHIHISTDTVDIYDCTEFNDAFRHIDVACDVAFLAMDLDFHERPELSRLFVTQFAAHMRDSELELLMDFYKCYRACVRGKVESLHSMGETVGAVERTASLDLARRYFRLALRYALGGSSPRVWVCMGRVASGKSALADALGRETGWRVVSSDRVRKSLAGVPLTVRGGQEERARLYSVEMTQRVYDELWRVAQSEVEQGRSVILDATFSLRAQRDAMRQKGGLITWIVAEAGDSMTLRRLRERENGGGVVSDARVEDQAALNSRFEPPDELPAGEWLRITTESETETTLERLMVEIATRNART